MDAGDVYGRCLAAGKGNPTRAGDVHEPGRGGPP